MTIYRAIYGIGEAIPADDPIVGDDRVRIYHGEHVTVLGTETVEVEYFCGQSCLATSTGYDESGGWPVATVPGDGERWATVDVEPVYGDWPDYDVHCATCGDLLHGGSPIA